MDAGRLNRLVTIQSLQSGVDEIGQPVTTWVTLADVWANVLHLSGVETIKGGAEASSVKASIRIRYRTDVTAAMRVMLGSTVYQIKAVMPDEAGRRYVDLACEAING
jgi:SPP1 family predicted phage head-tail adaptor